MQSIWSAFGRRCLESVVVLCLATDALAQPDTGLLVFSVRSWASEYTSRDVAGGVQ